MLEERGAENPLAARRKHQLHRVVHAAGHHRLDSCAVGPGAKDMRRPGDKRRLALALVRLFGKRPFAPVDPTIGSAERAVDVVGAAGERLALEPLFALVGHAVAVGVGEFPDAGGRADKERAIEPHQALGQHQLVGVDGALVIDAVVVGIFQADDAVGLVDDLFGDRIIRAGRLGHVQSAAVVEVGHDRPLDQRRPGGQFERESVGQRERVAAELHLACPPRTVRCRQQGQDKQQAAPSSRSWHASGSVVARKDGPLRPEMGSLGAHEKQLRLLANPHPALSLDGEGLIAEVFFRSHLILADRLGRAATAGAE